MGSKVSVNWNSFGVYQGQQTVIHGSNLAVWFCMSPQLRMVFMHLNDWETSGKCVLSLVI